MTGREQRLSSPRDGESVGRTRLWASVASEKAASSMRELAAQSEVTAGTLRRMVSDSELLEKARRRDWCSRLSKARFGVRRGDLVPLPSVPLTGRDGGSCGVDQNSCQSRFTGSHSPLTPSRPAGTLLQDQAGPSARPASPRDEGELFVFLGHKRRI